MLALLLDNLVENALRHDTVDEPTVRVAVSPAVGDREAVRFEIRDTNDRIALEIDTLRAGTETPLQHGEGVGLWISYRCVRELRGEIDFDYDDGNVVTVTMPELTAQ